MAQAANKSTALWVIRRLRRAGHQALLAGGCVRDMLLGIRSSDYDVATDATPQQVRRLFPHVLLLGAKFGVAVVIHRRRKVEVTTFRSDVSYSDHRRPDRVEFTNARQDALRRDFTINGMFYDPVAGEVIDYVGGRRDLAAGIVRTIGRPHLRLEEDYLRMLRAVRFAVRFAFTIEPRTASAIRRRAANIASISGERVFDELSKMLSRPDAAAALAMLHDLGLARAVLPELFSSGQVLWDRSAGRAGNLARYGDLSLTLAGLLCELPSGQIERITRRWGASNELRGAITWLAAHLDDWRLAARPEQGGIGLADFKRLMAGDFVRLRRLWRVRELQLTGSQAASRAAARRARAIDPARVAPQPLVTGADLKAMGLTEGPRLGRILRQLYDEQLEERLADRPAALARAQSLIDAAPGR